MPIFEEIKIKKIKSHFHEFPEDETIADAERRFKVNQISFNRSHIFLKMLLSFSDLILIKNYLIMTSCCFFLLFLYMRYSKL